MGCIMCRSKFEKDEININVSQKDHIEDDTNNNINNDNIIDTTNNTEIGIIVESEPESKPEPKQLYDFSKMTFSRRLHKQDNSIIYMCEHNDIECVAKLFIDNSTFDTEYNNLVDLGDSEYIVKLYGKHTICYDTKLSNKKTLKKSDTVSYDELDENTNPKPQMYNILVFEQASCDLDRWVKKFFKTPIEQNNIDKRIARHYATADIGIKIANCLKYLHDIKKYAHLDIKTQNILVFMTDKTIEVKLCDVAFATNNPTTTDSRGSPLFVAPEVLHSDKDDSGKTIKKLYDPKLADIFSFGVTLYFVIHGYHPNCTEYDDLTTLLSKRINDDVICKPYINITLGDIIHGMTTRNPKYRDSLNDIHNNLVNFMDEYSIDNLGVMEKYHSLMKFY